jgi:Mg-chelatase subunit ChlD/tetratricopeptide (TPR) repeat protein
MNEDQTTLNPVGDEVMEARIVAWVLGQASAFEAAELETWCETYPEWRVFQRRMLALHGLLGQAVEPSANATWKLSDQRRAALDGILGTKDVVVEAKQQTRKKRWWPQLTKFAALLLVFLSVAYTAFLGIFGKVGEGVAMSQEVASYSPEMPAEMNGPVAPSNVVGDADDFGDGWAGKKERKTVAKRMAAPMDAPVAADGSLAFQKTESAAEHLPRVLRKEIPATPSASGSAETDAASNMSKPMDSHVDIVSGGIRSGSHSITQNSIDGVLNNPAAESGLAQREKITRGVVEEKAQRTEDQSMFDRAGVNFHLEYGQEKDEQIRTNPAMSSDKNHTVDQVRRNLYMAEGNYNLGKLDDAKKEFEGVLRVDPNNKAARRWLERIAGAKSDYYRSAYDHTRAEMLMEVDKAWELATPESAVAANDMQAKSGEIVWSDPDCERSSSIDLSKLVSGKSWGYDQGNTPFAAQEKDEFSALGEKEMEKQPELLADQSILNPPHQSFSKLHAQGSITSGSSVSLDSNLIKNGMAPTGSNMVTIDAKKLEAAILAQSDLVEEKRKQRDDLQRRAPMVTGEVKSARKILTDFESRKLQESLVQVESELQEKQKSFEEEVSKLEKMKKEVTRLQQSASVNPKSLPILDEISTTTEAYSTFSLRVSDASFKLAQAALARGERPAPESVRVEEFYNAFDYGDPVPSAKEPVSCFMEQAAHPLFASRNLVRISMRTAEVGRSAGQPLHLTLLVDQSGSMVRADRSAVMNAAIAELTTLLGPQDQVSIVGFARTPRLIAEKIPGNEGARIRQTLAAIPSDGGTNLEQAMALAQEISQRHMQPGAQNRILLMTDGAANLGNAKPQELAERVKSMRQSGLAFDIAGIGTDGLNDELLLELARHGNGRYYVVNQLKDAGDGFAKQLAGAFRPAAENVKVQVHFNPERVSRYRLIGFEKDRLKTEDFRNDSVDAAELAAAEAGQAIYQVELLPEGRGDIGEVSVRFRDTAAAQMVERKWTIVHQPSAPAWDRASPSMQLAGLAMFAGEKLKGGAVGDMVTFQDWQAVRANVQQYYQQNQRVAQLMDMIRQIEP